MTHHRCKVRQSGRTTFYAYCKPRSGKCAWRGERRVSLLRAWLDARAHDPMFPQGDSRAEIDAM